MTHTDREFPMMHLAMISMNGTIWDISLNEKISPSKKYLFKLPPSCSYHGYSDDKGILYFIDGYLRNVIQFHLSFNNYGHKNVAKLKTNDMKIYCNNGICLESNKLWCYTQSLPFGNMVENLKYLF